MDLRTISTPSPSVRCAINDAEVYELRLIVLPQSGPGGATRKIEVMHSADGASTWSNVPLRLTLKSWWRHIFNHVGGDIWPPRGEDVEGASIKDGKLTLRYSDIFSRRPDGCIACWEAVYLPGIGRWEIYFLESF